VREWLLRFTRAPADAAPPGPSEWPALLDEAERQGLLAALHEWAEEARAPADVLDALVPRHRRLLARGVAQLDRAGQTIRGLQAAGLRALPLKGAAVSERLYGSPAHRPMGDVDVLVLDDFDAACRHLAAQGAEVLERADHAWTLRDAGTGLLVEVHRSVTSAPGFFPMDADGLWRTSRAVPGLVGRVPAAADLLVHLALHAAFQHGFVLTLVQWLDFRRLLETEDLDPAEAVRAAEDARAAGCVRAALRAARTVVGGPARPDVEEAMRPTPALETWLDTVLAAPVRLITPGGVPLRAARWRIAAGRRGALVLRTVLATPEAGRSPLVRPLAVARRAAQLLGRWGPSRSR
jgi:hypothetical protein